MIYGCGCYLLEYFRVQKLLLHCKGVSNSSCWISFNFYRINLLFYVLSFHCLLVLSYLFTPSAGLSLCSSYCFLMKEQKFLLHPGYYLMFIFHLLQRDAIIDIFYDKYLDQLIDVIITSCPPKDVPRTNVKSVIWSGRTEVQAVTTPEILLNICELLCFCVVHHPTRIR